MMPLRLRFWAARKLRQAAGIACVPIVFAYIFFDVLDLDGSNLTRFLTHMERAAIVAEAITGIELQDPPQAADSRDHLAALSTDHFREIGRPRQTRTLSFALPYSTRSHGDRASSQRDFHSDASPDH
jgi:hypothetical protein